MDQSQIIDELATSNESLADENAKLKKDVEDLAEEKEGRLCNVGDDPMEKDCVLTTCGHTFARTS
eukprot:SAG22_NODE_15024_length_359_cov_0.926923_1_plen_64_part_10